ncbi:hypothetical protein [Paenibacillus sp. cl141a]|uniref:hypothetical protein n=1 Tax=Paenibacillus sp. cl141a TaxID=1761877 RepID=UPI000B892438|nr:hypothetical protein [Paenibacillus sp. cl141a]
MTILSVYMLSSNKMKLYGNDKESIVNVIHSIDGYENKAIDVLDIHDNHDSRVVAFTSDQIPAYIQFTRNAKGNYEWNHIEADRDAFGFFMLNYPKEKTPRVMIVASAASPIAKMQVKVNGELLEQTFAPYRSYVSYIDLPPSDEQSYTFRDYKFFDKDGVLLDK